MKARTKGQKRRGRPHKTGVLRTESGRISRSAEAKEIEAAQKALEYKLMMETATWKRRQLDPSLSWDEARKQEHGSVIHAWKELHEAFKRRHGADKINPMMFTAQHLETAQQIQQAYEDYRFAIASRNPRSASDFSGPSGYDGSDPFDEDREKRDKRAIERWKAMRSAILSSGPMGMMAVEGIVIENKPLDKLIGDLRLALNAVERMNRIAKAA